MTVPSDAEFDARTHLCVADIALDDNRSPALIRVTLKQSKTDPFRKGVNIFVGRTGTDLCPVAALLDYLSVRGSSPGPLFTFADGRLLTRQRFVERVREGLSKTGIDQSKYCGHSFRIGAATTAAARGVEDCIIKILGRWESLAYQQYVKVPREQLWWLFGSISIGCSLTALPLPPPPPPPPPLLTCRLGAVEFILYVRRMVGPPSDIDVMFQFSILRWINCCWGLPYVANSDAVLVGARLDRTC